MGKKVLGVIVGLIVSGVVVGLVEYAGYLAFPPPEAFNPADPDPLLLKPENFIGVALAWALGPLSGGLVAGRIWGSGSMIPAFVIGGLFLAADVFNLVAIPSPTFLWVVGILVPLPAAMLGVRLMSRKEQDAAV